MSRLSFCLVDSGYCDYLRQYDPCVPYTMAAKASRPFVGVLLTIDGINYYAPLSSPKPKHLKMKNQVDLLKINNGIYGVINFNNMIPVHNNSIQAVDLTVSASDSPDTIQYKALLSNQLTWCNANKDSILKRAEKLYKMIVNGSAYDSLVKRCCKFQADETLLKKYCSDNGWTL